MTYAPNQIYGPLTPRTNTNVSLSPSLPGLTYSGSAFIGSGTTGELYCKTPAGNLPVSGITAELMGQLFLNGQFNSSNINLISCFAPEYYIDTNKNVIPTMSKALGSVTFSAIAGGDRDRYEIITINYDLQPFLTNLSGNTANGISNLQVDHSIVAGNTTISADYIFYRKLGRLAV